MTPFKKWFTQVNETIVAQMAIQKVTQKQLAEAVGVDPATINRKLKDPGKFTTGEFGQVCEFLKIDMKKV